MARKKTTTVDGAQEQPEAGRISKTDAVRTVLADGNVMPQEGVAALKDRFGIDMKPQQFSTIKSQLKKREGKPKGKRGRKARTVLSAPVAANGSVDLLGTLEAIKHLVEEHGADKVKRMVDLVR